jgi:hypothetical protein
LNSSYHYLFYLLGVLKLKGRNIIYEPYACKYLLRKIYFIVFTFTYMCIHCLGHPPTPGRTCSALLFSDFVEEKT